MRDLADSPKLQGQSCPEIADWLNIEAKRLGRKGIRWKRRVSAGPLLNFLVAWYQSLPPEDRERIARGGHDRLRTLLSIPADEPAVVSRVNTRGGSARCLGDHGYSREPVGDHATGNGNR